MPDGSHAALHPPQQARPPAPSGAPSPTDSSLADALERLLACAGQGLHPDGVLRDIRALLRGRGLLSSPGPGLAAGPTRHRPDAPPAAEAPAADARR